MIKHIKVAWRWWVDWCDRWLFFPLSREPWFTVAFFAVAAAWLWLA